MVFPNFAVKELCGRVFSLFLNIFFDYINNDNIILYLI